MLLKCLAGTLALLLLIGCSGGTTSDQQAGQPNHQTSSSVALLLTDAPLEGYDEVNLLLNRVSLLPVEGSDVADEIVLFEGAQQVNLLDLRHHTELFSVNDNVPVGDYALVRLYSSHSVELVIYGENDTDTKTQAKLDYEYLDLIPETPVKVTGGETTYLEIDIDLEMSMLSYDAGTGLLYFEPAVSMRTFIGTSDNTTPESEEQITNGNAGAIQANLPLVSVRGLVREALAENHEQQGRLLVCPSAQAATRACTRLVMNEHTHLFSSDVSPIQIEQLAVGASVIVMGHLTQPDSSGQRSISIYTLIEGQRPSINIRSARITGITKNQSVTLANGRLASLSEEALIITQQGQLLAAGDFTLPAEVTMFGQFKGSSAEKIALLIVKEGLADDPEDKQVTDPAEITERVQVIHAEFDRVLESSAAVYQVTLNGESLRVEAAKAHLVVTGSGRVTANNTEQAPNDLDHGARLVIRGFFKSAASPDSETATTENSERTFVAEHLILHRLPAQRGLHHPDGHPSSNAPGLNRN